MRKLFTLLSVAVVAIAVGAAPVFAKGGGPKPPKAPKTPSPKGITFILTGNYSQFAPGFGCVGACIGHIVGVTTASCDVAEGMAVTMTVFDYMDGICDDGPSAGQSATAATLPACDGRYTARVEECSRLTGFPSKGGVDAVSGQVDFKPFIGGTRPVDATISRGAMEVCFDSGISVGGGGAPADCWNAPFSGSELVVFEGTTLSQTVSLKSGGLRTNVSARSEFTATATPQWIDPEDGKSRNAKKLDKSTSHLTAEPTDGSNCGSIAASPTSTALVYGAGCGLAGVSTKK